MKYILQNMSFNTTTLLYSLNELASFFLISNSDTNHSFLVFRVNNTAPVKY